MDRARPSTLVRSSICEQCFEQYCYDPNNPPSKSELPGRKLIFVDPDPQGLDALEGFLGKNKLKLVGAFIGLAAFVAILIGGLQVYSLFFNYSSLVDIHHSLGFGGKSGWRGNSTLSSLLSTRMKHHPSNIPMGARQRHMKCLRTRRLHPSADGF